MSCRGENGECAKPDVSGLCWGHRKMLQRLGRIDLPLQEPRGPHARLTEFDRLFESALVLLEVRPTDKQGWRRAKNRLGMAAVRYAHTRKKRRRPPRPRRG